MMVEEINKHNAHGQPLMYQKNKRGKLLSVPLGQEKPAEIRSQSRFVQDDSHQNGL